MRKGSHQTEEAKRKIGENGFHYGMLGKNHSPETREKMRLAHLGQNKGKKLSTEHKLTLSIARKRFYQRGGIHPRGMLGKKTSETTKAILRSKFSGPNNPRWKGGYKNQLWLARQRKVSKRANGGKHTREQWEALKQKFNYMCLCCKRTEPTIRLTEDHVIPISKGGTNDIDNIQPLCQSCNSFKWTAHIDYRTHFTSTSKQPAA